MGHLKKIKTTYKNFQKMNGDLSSQNMIYILSFLFLFLFYFKISLFFYIFQFYEYCESRDDKDVIYLFKININNNLIDYSKDLIIKFI